jgi:hypothetical protein
MLDSLGTVLASLIGAAAVGLSAWWGRRAYTRVKEDRDRIRANEQAVDAAMQRVIESRRQADTQVALDPKRRDEFEQQP